MSKKSEHDAHIEEVKNDLRKFLKPGDTVYCNLKHVSRSGMYRVINLFIIKDNQPRSIDWLASQLLEGYDNNHEGCKAGGCGMDMGFHLVYNLGYSLYPDGFDCIGVKCRGNDHFNGMKVNHHSDGGYAFRQEWL
ncbi:MAG: hypothetical protein KGI08_11590 [Thaumarchaeota archaeon]|nr:hypothetical protein [Nitrososphaerota archaeon]